MTRLEAIDRCRHELCGMIADAATHEAKGAELSLKLRSWFKRVDAVIGSLHDEIKGPLPAQPTKETRK